MQGQSEASLNGRNASLSYSLALANRTRTASRPFFRSVLKARLASFKRTFLAVRPSLDLPLRRLLLLFCCRIVLPVDIYNGAAESAPMHFRFKVRTWSLSTILVVASSAHSQSIPTTATHDEIERWLQSSDPRMVSWGATFAASKGDKDALPAPESLAENYKFLRPNKMMLGATLFLER